MCYTIAATVVRRLSWDSFNVPHIARHNVVPEEVEEVCHGNHLALQTYGGRLLLIGPTFTGRMLGVVLSPEGRGVYYPVTARPASKKERKLYSDTMKGNTP